MDWARIEGIGLGYLVRLSHKCTYMVMVTTLCEWWHSETATFHLPTGDMTVILEDVYWILKLPIRGTLVMVMREMTAEVPMKRLVGLGMPFQIRRGQFARDENSDRVAPER